MQEAGRRGHPFQDGRVFPSHPFIAIGHMGLNGNFALRSSGMKKALCIGLTTFDNPSIAPLAGCVNDANLVAAILRRHFGFSEADIRLLADDSATKAGVLNGLDWLADGAARGDVLVFAIATHGTWVDDEGGGVRTGEESYSGTRKRVLITRDYSDSTCLLDSEVNNILDRIPEEANCYCLMDTCHAGMTTGRFPAGRANPRARYDERNADRKTPTDRDIAAPHPKRAVYRGAMNRITIYGCGDDEKSYDVPTSIGHHGLLTFSLCQVLHNYDWNISVGAAYKEVRRRVGALAKNLNLTQTPRVDGSWRLMSSNLFR